MTLNQYSGGNVISDNGLKSVNGWIAVLSNGIPTVTVKPSAGVPDSVTIQNISSNFVLVAITTAPPLPTTNTLILATSSTYSVSFEDSNELIESVEIQAVTDPSSLTPSATGIAASSATLLTLPLTMTAAVLVTFL
jgi:hypothetical protein